MTTKRTIPVTIQGRQYRVRADGEAEAIERAAALLEETMERVRARSGTADTVDVAVLAALNLANRLTSGHQSEAMAREFDARAAALADAVEAAIAEPSHATS